MDIINIYLFVRYGEQQEACFVAADNDERARELVPGRFNIDKFARVNVHLISALKAANEGMVCIIME